MNTFGIQRLIDSNQTVFATGNPIWYVYDNFSLTDPRNAATELGFQFVPSITGAIAGTTSVRIVPPPDETTLSEAQIRTALQAGVALRAGARKFTVSQTWVASMQATRSFATPQQVFEDSTVEGLLYIGTLYNIIKATPNEGVGNILSWDVYCNTTNI